MYTLKVLLRKEFLQIFRNKFILIIMFQLPIIQLLILPLAATYEMKNISLSIVDNDHSSWSQRVVNTFSASNYFRVTHYAATHAQALAAIEDNRADLIIEIPPHFERNLIRENTAPIALYANAIDGSKAGIGASYASAILARLNQEMREKLLPAGQISLASTIAITPAVWYNPTMNYKKFMVPGILGMLLTLVGAFLAALNIVSEKEKGTIEQINVSPVHKSTFILSKLIPFWVIGLVIFTVGLIICRFVYGIVPEGGYGTLYSFAIVYLLAFLGFGLLISTFSNTQQQAMFVAFFFMIIFILLSGTYTPITSMPQWAKVITWLNPLSYFVEVMRLVMLKGSRFADVVPQFWAICGFALVFNAAAIWNYRKSA